MNTASHVDTDQPTWHPLTEREAEVASALARGLSNKEIAEHLQISWRTVETHKYKVFKKLKLRSTVQLVHYAIVKKLIVPAWP